MVVISKGNIDQMQNDSISKVIKQSLIMGFVFLGLYLVLRYGFNQQVKWSILLIIFVGYFLSSALRILLINKSPFVNLLVFFFTLVLSLFIINIFLS